MSTALAAAGLEESLEAAYRARTPRSAQLFAEARERFPGGVSANIKAFAPYPPSMARAAGATLWDEDGNAYLDYLLVYGAIILGHGAPEVVTAVREQLATNGTPTFGTPHRLELALAEQLQRLVPSAQRVRFTNSGLEATLLTLRLAAAATGRPGVAKFEGHYHGAHDRVLVSYQPPLTAAGPAEEPAAVPDSLGVSPEVLERTLVLPWNDWASTARLLRLHARELGAVILEPVQGGFLPPQPGFLEQLVALARELGIVVVFDEVKTGFRLGLGGAQQHFGVTPDLTALGKVLGGGFPVGAVVGRRDLLELAAPGPASRSLFHSGTHNGHPTTMAAGLAVVRALERPGTYERLEGLATDLKERIQAAARRRGLSVQTPGVGSVFGVVFADQLPGSHRDLQRADWVRRRLLDLFLLGHGVYARPNDRYNLSLAHSEADVQRTGELIDRAFRLIA